MGLGGAELADEVVVGVGGVEVADEGGRVGALEDGRVGGVAEGLEGTLLSAEGEIRIGLLLDVACRMNGLMSV